MKNNTQAALAPFWQKRLLSIIEKIELTKKTDIVTIKALYSLLYSGDFALTFRSLICFYRLRAQAGLPYLCAFFNDCSQLVPFRLMALEALCRLNNQDMAIKLAVLKHGNHPLLERGLIVALGMQGRAALPYLAEFAASAPLYMRDSVLTEALVMAAGSSAALAAAAAEHQGLRRYLRYRLLPEDEDGRHFSIMPAPDYLLQIFLENGLTKQEYKALLHRLEKNE